MRYSKLIQQAIDFAVNVHLGQVRKGKTAPYVVHVLSVGLILARVTEDEHIITAGILHDTIEDCVPYGSVSKELLASTFNVEVARMVKDVTEQDKSLPWFERKMAAMQHIKDMSHDTQLVKSADVLHNLTELVQDLENEGDNVWKMFNASKKDTIKRYSLLIRELERVWPDNPLIPDLNSAHSVFRKLVNEAN